MLYLRNAKFLNSKTFVCTEGDFAIAEGPGGGISPIAQIPPVSELKKGDRVLQCDGKFATRAFACGHQHIYSALSRGMPPAPKAPASFVDVLELVWWRLDKCLDKESNLASALAFAIYMAKSGVTFCIDHQASPHAIDGCLSTLAQGLDMIGIGHLLCYETSCRDGEAIAEQGLAEHERYFSAGGKGHVGVHASFTVDDKTLKAAADLARKYDTGLHIHVAEGLYDQEHCLKTYGKTVVQRLADFGVLEMPKTILGHCVHVSEEDKKMLASSPCWLVQNVESNMNNNVGLAGYGYSKNVMIGTDGMHCDMIRSAQATYFSGIGVEGITAPQAYTRLRNVHRHAALHGACGDDENNVVILDYNTPTELNQNNALGHFFYGLNAGHVHTVISGGKVIVEDRKLVSCDEEELLGFIREQAARVWKKLR